MNTPFRILVEGSPGADCLVGGNAVFNAEIPKAAEMEYRGDLFQ